MQRLITDLGYEPRQRDNWYNLVDAPPQQQLVQRRITGSGGILSIRIHGIGYRHNRVSSSSDPASSFVSSFGKGAGSRLNTPPNTASLAFHIMVMVVAIIGVVSHNTEPCKAPSNPAALPKNSANPALFGKIIQTVLGSTAHTTWPQATGKMSRV